ncbi:MAG: YmdB family metallophosphoesterase [Erysipelotrichaceae bacterium]|nr:YmdB family metallophosphoesterase [Erysipelotrichaceae bacterium]
MKVLFIGDIVGKSGRDIVSSLLYSLKKEYGIDLVIANGENAAHGKGITYKIYKQFIAEGIDYVTMGNHTFSKAEINDHMEEMDRLVIPYNHVKRNSDNYYKLIEYKGLRFILTNLLGSVLIGESNMEAPEAFVEVLNKTSHLHPDFYFVDLHAETTAEKRVFVEYFRDYAKVVIGTHTHVQTADEGLLNSCAFISDVGMCGAYDSIIGRDVDETIRSHIKKEPTRYTIAEGPGIFCGVVIDIDEKNKKPVSIERIQIRP